MLALKRQYKNDIVLLLVTIARCNNGFLLTEWILGLWENDEGRSDN